MHIYIITGITQGLGYQLYNKLVGLKKDIIAISKKHEYDFENKIIQYDFSDIENIDLLQLKLKEYLKGNITKITFINNSGVIEPIEGIGEFSSYQQVHRHVKVNYIVPMLVIDIILKIVNSNCQIEILNISTGASERPIAGWSLYSSSKKAIKTFFNTLTIEKKNVQVYHIDPGVMNTNMQQKIREEKFPLNEVFIKYKEEGKLKNPEQVAQNIIKKYIERI